jgi:hypothetical protein
VNKRRRYLAKRRRAARKAMTIWAPFRQVIKEWEDTGVINTSPNGQASA